MPSRGTDETVSNPVLVDESKADEGLSRDKVFKILSNQRRRLTLRYLSECDRNGESVQLRALAEWIAAGENGISSEEVTYKQRKRVYTSLYQSHLPVLHRDGIIEYNRARGTISVTPTASMFDAYLGFDPETEPFWSYYWFGFGVVSVTIAALSWLNVLPLSGQLLALLVSLAVLMSAVAFARTS